MSDPRDVTRPSSKANGIFVQGNESKPVPDRLASLLLTARQTYVCSAGRFLPGTARGLARGGPMPELGVRLRSAVSAPAQRSVLLFNDVGHLVLGTSGGFHGCGCDSLHRALLRRG